MRLNAYNNAIDMSFSTTGIKWYHILQCIAQNHFQIPDSATHLTKVIIPHRSCLTDREGQNSNPNISFNSSSGKIKTKHVLWLPGRQEKYTVPMQI